MNNQTFLSILLLLKINGKINLEGVIRTRQQKITCNTLESSVLVPCYSSPLPALSKFMFLLTSSCWHITHTFLTNLSFPPLSTPITHLSWFPGLHPYGNIHRRWWSLILLRVYLQVYSLTDTAIQLQNLTCHSIVKLAFLLFRTMFYSLPQETPHSWN